MNNLTKDLQSKPFQAISKTMNQIGKKYIDMVILQMESQEMKFISLEDMKKISNALKTGDFKNES